MRFTLDEMNILSERLEKEEALLHRAFAETGESRAGSGLAMISRLQRKLEDMEAELEPEERRWLAALFEEEAGHLHGHPPDVYARILDKLNH